MALIKVPFLIYIFYMSKKRQPSRYYTKLARIENRLYRKIDNRFDSLLNNFLKKSINEVVYKAMKELNITNPRELIENYDMVVRTPEEGLIEFTFNERN